MCLVVSGFKFNSFILVIYIYFTSLILLMTPFVNEFLFKNLFLVALIIITILVNKFKVTWKILFFYTFLSVFVFLNLLLTEYVRYVFTDGISLILFSFIPLYLIGQKLVLLSDIKKMWFRFSILMTVLIPIFYIYRQNGYITYYDIGFFAHLNLLIQIYTFVESKYKRNITLIFIIIINILVLLILGSRMVLIASMVTSIFTFIILSNKKSIKFYFISLVIGTVSIFIINNLMEIMISINNLISGFGLRSRNLNLFISQLEGRLADTAVLSGRDNIYPIVIQFINENGIFPSGFGVVRKLTNGDYYHSHNFFLEMILIFGFTGVLIFLGLFIYKIILLIIKRYSQENPIILTLLPVLLVSFIIRSLTGTFFITDVIFLVCLGIIVSINTKVQNTSTMRHEI